MDECVEWISEEFGVDVGPWTIYRVLERAKYTHKVASKHSKFRNNELRDHWFAKTRTFRADQIVAIDESAANERTSERRRGWAPVNTECVASYNTVRTPRWSVLPAMTVDGYLDWEVIPGGYTKELFEAFIINKVLPKCQPWPAPRSILIMDNASQHDIPRLRAICGTVGVKVEQLPLYLPDYNPIEQSFHILKMWIRRNWQLMSLFSDLGEFLEHGIRSCMYRKDC